MASSVSKINQERLRLRQAVASWLTARRPKPSGLGFDVETTGARLKVDVAACWLQNLKHNDANDDNGNEVLKLRHAIVLCCPTRESCWPECSSAEAIVAEVSRLRDEAEAEECKIREQEPELRADDVLFEELALWEYERSVNPHYQELRQRLAELESMLYKGTRLERLALRPMAEKMYIATPTGLLQPNELRRDWGLLWVDPDKGTELIRDCKPHSCQPADQMKLLNNILASTMDMILSASVPRRRKPKRMAQA
ncbi:MAG TPA: hypothetical protein PLT23_07900 [Lentisphaeria bacterium]|nr:hypothetical protein [Lentisphaeria bacterium]